MPIAPISRKVRKILKDTNKGWELVRKIRESFNPNKTIKIMKPKKKPYTCPVCGGRRIVQNGFYNTVSGIGSTSDATLEKCRSCQGTGIVWC